MGTKGAFGLYRNGQTKATYNHYDSYPSELGEDIVFSIAKASLKKLNNTFDNIVLVRDNSQPIKEQIEECAKVVDVGDNKEWYWILRDAQGDLDVYVKKGLKYMIDGQSFLKDSLFCEWAYIINLDDNVLEVYKGFQELPDYNRYYDASLMNDKYKNCKLIAKIKLDDIMKMGEMLSKAILKTHLGELYY